MPRSLNHLVISGFVGKDPVLYDGKSKVATFSVAIDASYKKDGEWQDKTTWVNVTTYGPLAQYVKDNLTKGSEVNLVGRLANNTYTDKDGKTRQELLVEVTQKGELNILSKKNATPASEEMTEEQA